MSSLLDYLDMPELWEEFLTFKQQKQLSGGKDRELQEFIRNREYLPVVQAMQQNKEFPVPRKAEIGKMGSEKKRTVYIYPKAENYCLKLLTFLLIRKYDHLFADNLYSFRAHRDVKLAFRRLARYPGIEKMFTYKVDISNYFNSVDVEQFLPILRKNMADDPECCEFLVRLLQEPGVYDRGKWISERKGFMAGTPQSSFFANLYLADMDRTFEEQGILYSRYSDDIIVFARDQEELERCRALIGQMLAQKGLTVNPKKEISTAPGEKWTYLGFSFENGIIDISPVSVTKIKHKMRRKARALKRWQNRKGLNGECAAKAFVRAMNHKLFDNPADHELTWARWFCPVINTTASLAEIDRYEQDCIRYLVTDRRTKARFNCRYEQMKSFGYRSLVHEYYAEWPEIPG